MRASLRSTASNHSATVHDGDEHASASTSAPKPEALHTTSSKHTMSMTTPIVGSSRRTAHVFDANLQAAVARKTYFKTVCGGVFMVVLLIFAVLSIFWGSTWKIPAHQLPGWVVDLDGGQLGQTVAHALTSSSTMQSKISWSVLPASSFPGGAQQIAGLVLEEKTWVAIVINTGASSRFSASIASPNPSYNGSDAVTVYAVEARNENAFRSIIRPSIQGSLDALSASFARSAAQTISNIPNVNTSALLATSPQTITAPLGYGIVNLAPFNIPVATAVTFVGLIYQLILSFFVVMLSDAARVESGFSSTLRTRSLILLRLGTSFVAYFVVSLFYSLLSVAFQLDVSRKFGHSGFLVFWMLNYCSMLALGLALEAMITVLTSKFISFFMLLWLISNLSVCVFPMEVMPHIFRYGHGAPFYNVSIAIRTVVFGTRNVVGRSFGVLIVWIAISCITLPLFQWAIHRREAASSVSNTLPPTREPDVIHEKAISRESDAKTDEDNDETVRASAV